MLSWRDVLDQEVRREELERQARHWQVEQTMRGADPQRNGRLAGYMVQLGAWMERTGCRIQGRFAGIEPMAILAATAAETQLHGCS